MEGSPGMRKGAWTSQEDILLRACIQKYGEGKWHLVPQRTGLNRRGKSCRLRWMNYLNPNINRENFTEDEVDIMMRLHKLLGNRWSLIAGRLPRRTANDVKNYWHTNLRRKVASDVNKKETEKTGMKSPVVIKPKALTFSKGSAWLRNNRLLLSANDHNESTKSTSDSGKEHVLDNGNTRQQSNWWESLLEEDINGGEGYSTWSSLLEEQPGTKSFTESWDEEFSKLEDLLKEDTSCWSSTWDNSLDVNFWDPPSN